jgi:hypothetical protein
MDAKLGLGDRDKIILFKPKTFPVEGLISDISIPILERHAMPLENLQPQIVA